MVERICWALLALIHFAPFAALFSPSMIERLYDIAPDGEAFPLLHHRAALFGCVVIVCGCAALDPAVRQLAVMVTALSMVSFLAIYTMNGMPESLRTIAIADAVGLPFLAYVAWRAFFPT
ncbi:MAG: phosphopantetheine adenylyltransferase [Pseudomonadota bacterium]